MYGNIQKIMEDIFQIDNNYGSRSEMGHSTLIRF